MQVITMMLGGLFRNGGDDLRDSVRSLGLDGFGELLSHARIAALLHDLGHLPLSHVLEGIITEEFSNLGHCGVEVPLRVRGGVKEHEVTTYLILSRDREFREMMRDALPDVEIPIVRLMLHLDLLEKMSIIGQVSPGGIHEEDSAFLKRIRGSEGYFLLRLIHGLLSGDLDADRVDYMLRDLYFTGASVGANLSIVDVERIMDNIKVRRTPSGYRVSFDEKARASLEGFIIARYNLYKWVYLHHKVVLMNTLAREMFRMLIRNSHKLSQEVTDYLCKILRFMGGSLGPGEIMEMTDPYLISLILRNRNELREKLGGGFSVLLDSVISRRTPYRALWKRDVEFLSVVKQGQLDVINSRFPGLLGDPTHREGLFSLFLRKLSQILERRGLCREFLEVKPGEEPPVLVGYRDFEADIELRIDSGGREVEMSEISPLAASVSEAWTKSPHLFIFINQGRLASMCGDLDIAKLRQAIVDAVVEAVNEYSGSFIEELKDL
jgi:hypothetical protein